MFGKLILGFSVMLAAVFWAAYYAFFFKWRACFNELGRCFDEDTGVVYHAQSGGIWLSLAVGMTCLSLAQIWRLIR